MKGLNRIPDPSELLHAYEELQGLGVPAELENISLYSQWSRFDPRLAELWVQHCSLSWKNFSPLDLRKFALTQPWPEAMGVLLEFVEKTVSESEKQLFRNWKKTLMTGFNPAPNAQFFIGLRKIAGQAMFDDARFSLKEYQKWGYLGREILFNKAQSRLSTHSMTPAVRARVLNSLLKEHTRITISDYLTAIHHCITRRQAERDLAAHPKLRRVGKTKGAVYLLNQIN